MGYEVPASIGIRLADETRDVFAMVGDGGYLMMPTELVTAVQERVKVIVVLVQNHGFHSIGSLSESLGSQRFGTRYRYRDAATGRLDGDAAARRPRRQRPQPRRPRHRGALARRAASRRSRRPRRRPADGGPVVIHVETDPLVYAPDSEAWWDVPVSEVSDARLDPGRPTPLPRAQASPASAARAGRRQPGTTRTAPGRHARRRPDGRRPRRTGCHTHRRCPARRGLRLRRPSGPEQLAAAFDDVRAVDDALALVADDERRRGPHRVTGVRPRGAGARLPRGRQAGPLREAADDGRRVVLRLVETGGAAAGRSSRSASCAGSTRSTPSSRAARLRCARPAPCWCTMCTATRTAAGFVLGDDRPRLARPRGRRHRVAVRRGDRADPRHSHRHRRAWPTRASSTRSSRSSPWPAAAWPRPRCSSTAGIGYEVRCEAVAEHGNADDRSRAGARLARARSTAAATRIPDDFRDRFATAYDLEVQAWVDATRLVAGRRTHHLGRLRRRGRLRPRGLESLTTGRPVGRRCPSARTLKPSPLPDPARNRRNRLMSTPTRITHLIAGALGGHRRAHQRRFQPGHRRAVTGALDLPRPTSSARSSRRGQGGLARSGPTPRWPGARRCSSRSASCSTTARRTSPRSSPPSTARCSTTRSAR